MTNKIFNFAILFFVFVSITFSQTTANDTLSLKEGFWGMIYLKGNQGISSKEFDKILQSSPDKSIYELYSKGESQSTIAQVGAFGGGFCLGYGLFSKPTNTPLAIVGGVVAIGAFILDSNGKSNMNDAITKYNSSMQTSDNFIPYKLFGEYNLLSFSISF